jgi:shikimate dehydrogenase
LAATGWPAAVPLLEVLYDPWPTALAAAAARAGAPVAGGLALLVHQAAVQVELMSGKPAPILAMRAAGERALAARAGRHGG